MVKKIMIKNNEAKNNFKKYLARNEIQEGLNGRKKRDFIKKMGFMIYEKDKLKTFDNGNYKIFISDWKKKGIILFNYHQPSHICADKMFINIFNEYYKIKRDSVREYVEKCKACNLASSFKTKDVSNYISAIKI
ncbi:hypothetical protein DMUE_0734 [Dictyocoela muelleri]|nr:hypothetical protein DMUE_0734 [Dictyocoela muelleri]